MGRDVVESVPLATPNSPAVSSARVASRGRWSRSTEAARVMGRSCVASSSGAVGSVSGGAEEGDWEEEGEGEAMLGSGRGFFLFVCCDVG